MTLLIKHQMIYYYVMSGSIPENTVIGLTDELFRQAVEDRASDVHIEPQSDLTRIRYRVDGMLREIRDIPLKLGNAVASRIKIISEMDIGEKRLPQDGRFHLIYNERRIDLRVSTMPTIYGEKVVARILDKGNADLFNIEGIGLSPENLKQFQRFLNRASGLLLITGPTGSGKTTTLYAAMTNLNQVGKNIVTVEDPVEYLIDGINQTQVNKKAGLTFAVSLRSILRQDPDIIMVGEIRDKETASVAVRAAVTGHLVLATMHTNNAAGAITRLLDMGVEPYMVASAVGLTTAQRLIRLNCPKCSREYALEEGAVDRFFLGLEPDYPVNLFKGNGCAACGYQGYRGRVAIHEVLPATAELRRRILESEATEEAICRSGRKIINLKEDGVRKIMAGITTIEEVRRAL